MFISHINDVAPRAEMFLKLPSVTRLLLDYALMKWVPARPWPLHPLMLMGLKHVADFRGAAQPCMWERP
jgi:hypothetical protein